MRVEFLLKTDSGYPKDTGVRRMNTGPEWLEMRGSLSNRQKTTLYR